MSAISDAIKKLPFRRSLLRKHEDGLVYVELDNKPSVAERLEAVGEKVDRVLFFSPGMNGKTHEKQT